MQTPLLLVEHQQNQGDDDCACPDKALLLTFSGEAGVLENDCACPDGAWQVSPRPHLSPLFTTTSNTLVQSLTPDFYLAFSPYAPAGPSVLNTAAYHQWQSFTTSRSLTQPLDYQLVEQGLLQAEGQPWRPQYSPPHTLTAWLHITNACNLDCPYCYVRKSSARMSEELGLRAIRQIFYTAQQHGFKQVKLKYAGGEATLHFRLVKLLHEEAIRLAQESDLTLQEVVLSNGVHLRPQDADWLADSGIKLMISLDGLGAIHDQQRPLKGGGASFPLIVHTIDKVLLPRGIRPDITLTVTQLNAHYIAPSVRWVLERDLPLSLNFYRQNLNSASRTDLALEEQAIIGGMVAAYQEFEAHLPPRPFFNGLLDRVQAEAHAHTCGVQHSYLVISHTGQLAQCQMHLDSPVHPRIEGDLLPLAAAGPIQNIPVDKKEGCRDCLYRYRCSGGCPLETYRATGRWDIRSPHCHIYQTLLPQALRLEGLRLLKTNGFLP